MYWQGTGWRDAETCASKARKKKQRDQGFPKLAEEPEGSRPHRVSGGVNDTCDQLRPSTQHRSLFKRIKGIYIHIYI